VQQYFEGYKIDDCEAMQRITHNFFKCAGSDFHLKLNKFHDMHSHGGKIRDYDEDSRIDFKSKFENITLPALSIEGSDADGGMFSPLNFEPGWCTELRQDPTILELGKVCQDKIEELACKLVPIFANIRVSCPPLSIEPAWHNPTSLCPEGQHKAYPDDVDFNVNEHQFVDPVAVSMNSKETVPKVCIVFPMLRQTVGKVTNVLVKALVVVRV